MNHQQSDADELDATDPEIIVVSIFLQSGKQSTDPTQTPQSEHVEEAIVVLFSRKYEPVEFGGDRGDDVENKPRSYIFPSDLLTIVDEEVSCFVEISHEESQRDIYGEETIDYIIGYGQTSYHLLQESEFKQRNPTGIKYQNGEKSNPSSAIIGNTIIKNSYID